MEPILPESPETAIQIATSNDLLVKAQWPHLARNEQRLVIYMLSLIRRSDKDFETYRISVRELGNVLGLKRKDLYQEFDNAAEGLMQKTINFIDPEYTKGKKQVRVAWCSFAAMVRGEGYVELRFDPALKPFLLTLKGNFTIWGDRRSIIRLKSHYALRLYQFIKYNQGLAAVDHRQSTTVELDWLREYLAIPDDKYRLFGHLKSRVLEPSQKDIRDKTDVEFDYETIKRGRKVHALKFTWKSNKRHKQLEFPGMSDKVPVSLADILSLEFGISPEKKVQELVLKYSDDHILAALEVARDYIDNLRQRGEKISNIGGIARKAIEEGWQPKKALIEIEYEENIKALTDAKEAASRREEEEEAKAAAVKAAAMAKYAQMSEREKTALLGDFRQYLVETNNKLVLSRFDENGITPGPVEGMFGVFVRERLGGER